MRVYFRLCLEQVWRSCKRSSWLRSEQFSIDGSNLLFLYIAYYPLLFRCIIFVSLVTLIAKRTKSKNRMQITKFPARLSQHKRVLWDIQGCRRSFRFTSVLGTPAFALKEIFKIIHHFKLFVRGSSLLARDKHGKWKRNRSALRSINRL